MFVAFAGLPLLDVGNDEGLHCSYCIRHVLVIRDHPSFPLLTFVHGNTASLSLSIRD